MGTSTDESLPIPNLKNIYDNPLLVSSIVPSTPVDEVEDERSDHVMVVDKIIRVLANSSSVDHAMEGSLSNASSSSNKPNDDMILSHF